MIFRTPELNSRYFSHFISGKRKNIATEIVASTRYHLKTIIRSQKKKKIDSNKIPKRWHTSADNSHRFMDCHIVVLQLYVTCVTVITNNNNLCGRHYLLVALWTVYRAKWPISGGHSCDTNGPVAISAIPYRSSSSSSSNSSTTTLQNALTKSDVVMRLVAHFRAIVLAHIISFVAPTGGSYFDVYILSIIPFVWTNNFIQTYRWYGVSG